MTQTKLSAWLGTALLLAGADRAALAEDRDARLDEAVIAGTYQASTTSHANNEATGQLYLLGSLDMGPGAWHLELRGGTTPRHNGLAGAYESNALVGETVNSHGDGRIAATQLYYELPVGPGELRAGLLDPTALLDANETANDEYTQFLADAFVNNPAIGFPSFVLGGAYRADLTRHVDYKLFVGSDSGLQDDTDPTYHNVFSVGGHRGDHHKGVFTTGELGWHANGYVLQGGIWYDTGKVDRPGRSYGSENGYGVYFLAGAPIGPGRLEGRAAIVNEDAQAAANFLSLSYELPMRLSGHGTTLGMAVARTGDSSQLAFRSKPIVQAEGYWRINVAGPLYVSPDIQYIRHAGFRASRSDAVIGGARVGLSF